MHSAFPLLGRLGASAAELLADLLREWRALCPPRLRQWFRPDSPQVCVHRSGGSLSVEAHGVQPGVAVALMLPETDVLQIELELPAAAARNLRQAVAYRLLRDSPLAPERMLFDICSRPRRPYAGPVTVAVALCHRRDVEGVLALARDHGLEVGSVGFNGVADGDISRTWVFHTSERVRANGRRQRWNRALAASAVLGACALFVLGLGLAHWQQTQLRDEAARLTRAAVVDSELLAQASAVRALREQLREALPATRVTSQLNALAEHLPADAWLERSEFAEGTMVLGGRAPEPSRALAALKSSALLAGIRLDSVARSANPGEPPQFVMSLGQAPGRN